MKTAPARFSHALGTSWFLRQATRLACQRPSCPGLPDRPDLLRPAATATGRPYSLRQPSRSPARRISEAGAHHQLADRSKRRHFTPHCRTATPYLRICCLARTLPARPRPHQGRGRQRQASNSSTPDQPPPAQRPRRGRRAKTTARGRPGVLGRVDHHDLPTPGRNTHCHRGSHKRRLRARRVASSIKPSSTWRCAPGRKR
jgi:hypothetical protein